MSHCLDNKYVLSLLIDILLTSLAYSFMKPAGFQTMERGFLRNVSPGSKELFAQGRKAEQTHALHGSATLSSGSAFVVCGANYQLSHLNTKTSRVIHVAQGRFGFFLSCFPAGEGALPTRQVLWGWSLASLRKSILWCLSPPRVRNS